MATEPTEQRYTIYRLANMAGCAGPDSQTSAGALFLQSIAESVISEIDSNGELSEDMATEIADNAPDVYTHKLWQEFVDLAAYTEDPSELGADASDMEQCARVCLYMIAGRLVAAIRDDYTPETDDDATDDDDV